MLTASSFENLWNSIQDFFSKSGIIGFFSDGGWKNLIMILIGCVFLFLAIKKDFEPYLLVPIAFGMILVNLPFAGDELTKWEIERLADGSIDWSKSQFGLIAFLQKGLPIYPCLIFLCTFAPLRSESPLSTLR